MRAPAPLFIAVLAICLGGEGIAQEKIIPSTVSEGAAAIIKATNLDELVATTKQEWQAAWDGNE